MMEEPELYAVVFAGNKHRPKQMTLVPSEPHSRYKTRQLQVQVEGKGSKRTSLVNINDVAKDMHVPPSYICAYIANSLGVRFNFSTDRDPKRQAFIKGDPSITELSSLVKGFIAEVVLCPTCNLPELILEVESHLSTKGQNEGDVKARCQACGANPTLEISNSRFKKFILANPPTGRQKDAFLLKHEKDFQVPDDLSEDEEEAEDNEDDIVWLSDTSEAAAAQRRKDVAPSRLFAGLGDSSGGT